MRIVVYSSSNLHSPTDATKWLKKHKYNLTNAINAYFTEGGDSSRSASRDNSKKVGEIWDKFRGKQPKVSSSSADL